MIDVFTKEFTKPALLGKVAANLIAAALIFCSAAPISHGSEPPSSRGVVEMRFDLSAHGAGKDVSLWIPYPISDDAQKIEKISVNGNFAESGVYTDQEYSTPMLYAGWSKDAAERRMTFSFSVQREAPIDLDFPAEDAAWNPADYSKWLKAETTDPLNARLAKITDEITAGKLTVLAKARAIYDWVCDNMYRDPDTRGCGLGDVSTLLDKPGGKCADIHSVFVALARSAGVPSREVFGIRQGKENEVNITAWQHCWAEFYLPGRGWVPVDPGDVRKMMLKKGLSPNDPVPADLREAYWGKVDPYRLKLSVGRNLTLNPAQKGQSVNYLMYPYAEVDGNAIDWLDPEKFKYTIIYKKI